MSAPKLTDAQRACLQTIVERYDSQSIWPPVDGATAMSLYALGLTMTDFYGRGHIPTDAGRAALRGQS